MTMYRAAHKYIGTGVEVLAAEAMIALMICRVTNGGVSKTYEEASQRHHSYVRP